MPPTDKKEEGDAGAAGGLPEEATEKTLRRTIRGQRGWITRTIQAIDALCGEQEINKPSIGLELDSLVAKEAKLMEAHESLCNGLDDTAFEVEMKALEPLLVEIKAAKLKALAVVNPPEKEGSLKEGSSSSDSKGIKKNPKLPPLDIEVFRGDKFKWMSFYESFCIMVDENDRLDDRGKLVYLKKYLKDEPRRAVEGLISSDGKGGNYTKAMNILKERYGREDVLKEDLIHRIYRLDDVNGEDLRSTRNLVDEVHLLVGQLESLGVDVNAELGVAFSLSVREKMPPKWQEEWARLCEKTKVQSEKDFNKLLSFLQTELRVHEELARSKVSNSKKSPVDKKKETVPTASALKVEVRSSSKKPSSCTFCGGLHRPRECDVSMSSSSRMSKVKAVKGCHTCGMKGHGSDRCYWKAKCRICRGRHIDQLCESSAEVSQGAASSVSSEKAKFATTACLMRTATVVVNGKVMARLLADTGGSKTFIRADVAQQAKAEFIRKERMEIDHFGGKMLDDFDVVEVELGGVMTKESITIEAVCVPDLGKISEGISQEEVVQRFGEEFLPLADQTLRKDEELGILLGENFYDDVVDGPTNRISDGFKATKSKFGWMIHGGDLKQARSYAVKVLRVHCAEFEKFWELEHLGIKDQAVSEGKEDVLRDVEFKNNRYWISWPWREELRPDENRDVAEARLKRLESKMSDNEKQAYTQKIEELLVEGHIEEVPLEPEGDVSYLPHRAVIKETSDTTKIRIVYDCGAKKRGGLSLNDCLKTGPSLLPKVIGIFLRFRCGKIGTVADLVKAFLQIKLHFKDRDVTRFIWDGNEYRSTCVLFGATSSPSILNCVIQHHLEQMVDEKVFSDWILKKLKDDTYMDDCITSLHEKLELTTFWKESSEIFKKGSMQLQKIRSSVEGVGEKNLVGKKVLGLPWNEEKDVLSVEIPEVGTVLKTKRAVASFLGKVYDPLGILSPYLTPLKILLQEIWKQGLTWDELFTEILQEQVANAVQYFQNSKGIEFPRWIGTSQDLSAVSLHVFMDSSQRIYAGTIYVRVEKETDAVCFLLVAKAKLIPPKMAVGKFSPKFELLACVLGSRLLQTVIQELNWEGVETYFWTDSKVCLHWIKAAPQKWEVYVRNRVYQIQSIPGKWGFVNTEDNPADIPTRENGVDLKKWFEGPKWLSKDKENWPQENIDVEPIEVVSFKARETSASDPIKELINPSTSRWNVLVGAVARIKKFFKVSIPPNLLIIREIQKESFHLERELLQQGKQIPSSSKIYSINPTLDSSGLLRIGGRLHLAADLPETVRHPVIVTRCGSLDLLVLSIHAENAHAGPSWTLVELRRQGYWIIKGRKTVSAILKTCRRCRRFQAAPFSAPIPPLPVTRVQFTKPFGVTGVDLLGPLFLDTDKKVWMALFTCFQTRAIHLELVVDLSEIGMKRCFERFCGRRGIPEEVWSDHGTNFVALSKNLSYLKWHFIVERAPWWGGLWERLVGSVKSLLKRVIRKAVLDWERLESVMISIENVINRRPISYIWEGDYETPIPLSPMDFLVFGKVHSKNKVLDVDQFSQEWKNRESYKEDLKTRWESEYLLSVLGNFGKIWKGGVLRTPVVGEVVLLLLEDKPAQQWPLARVEKIHHGNDGIVRAVTVCFGKSRLVRPIRKIFPLELDPKQIPLPPKEDCDANVCHQPTGQKIEWIQCDGCSKWYHVLCINVEIPAENEEFKCQECQND